MRLSSEMDGDGGGRTLTSVLSVLCTIYMDDDDDDGDGPAAS